MEEKKEMMAEWGRVKQSLLFVISAISQEQYPNHSFQDCVIHTAVMTNPAKMSKWNLNMY